jgi:Ribonuclease G/E
VWQGRNLLDVYFEDSTQTDYAGSIVRARALRVLTGGKAAWFDAGLDEKIYAEKAENIRTGDVCLLAVQSMGQRGKAYTAKIIEKTSGDPELVMPPPPAWQRALTDHKKKKIVCRFADREAWHACADACASADDIRLEPLAKGPVHPELDDLLSLLSCARVSISGGIELVIERTEALTVIDINGGEKVNPTAVNLAAMVEIARQIRLRNIGGAIVIDALKMKMRADQSKVLNCLTRAVAEDPAGVHVFGMTKLGLVELTRTHRHVSLDRVEV